MHPDPRLTRADDDPNARAYLEQAFPIHAQKLVEIDGYMVAEPLRDETGAFVVSREALALRDAAMVELMTLAPIPSALDQILWAFGDEAVAEVTGRSIRPLKLLRHLFETTVAQCIAEGLASGQRMAVDASLIVSG